MSLLYINRYLGVTATRRRQEENPHKAGSLGDAREAGRSAFQKGHELDLSEIGSELVAVIVVLQPGMAFEWWAAIEHQAGRTAVMLHVKDRPSQPVRVSFLWFSPGVGGLLALPYR